MHVTGGVCHDTKARAIEAARAIQAAAREVAAQDGQGIDRDPAPDVVELHGARLGEKGRWWGRVELEPGTKEPTKAWLTWQHTPMLAAKETATYVYERQGAETRLGYSQSRDGFLSGSLNIFETTLDAAGEPRTAQEIVGTPADRAFARTFQRDDSAAFWKSPIALPADVEKRA